MQRADVAMSGVEGADVLGRLRELRCAEAQGFHVSRPLPPAAFVAWLTDWAAQPA